MRKDTYKFKIQNSKFKIIFYTTLFWSTFISTSFHIFERSEFPHVMPRCTAAMGILGEVSKMCCLVEDSHRHLRCRGMTSQGFPLEMLLLAYARWHDGREFKIQNYDDKIVVSSSRLGKVSKLPLLSLRSVGSKFKIDF